MADLPSWGFEEGDEIVPGRYAVRLLGGGFRYEAYLAWDDDLLTLVVAKLLRPDRVGDDGAHAALAREVSALVQASHPAIVRSFGAVLDGGRPHVLLEFLDGPRLSTLMRKHGVVIEQLLPLALEVCAALHHLHGHSIVHLDVKPRNIIMSAPPRLIDLSVARRLDDIHSITQPVGTDAYMAPEQCDTDAYAGQIGPPADVWGLGATLFHALTGERPFPRPKGARDSQDPLVRWPQLGAEPRELPKRVPEPLAELILDTLDKHPARRPAAAEVATRLEPLVAALPRKLTLGRRGERFS